MFALACIAVVFGAEPPPAAPAPTGPIDLIERLFGASNVAWVVGNGGLTVGLSPLGDASVVSWPSPSYTDQILHLGSNDPAVRRRRNMAADPAMGAFVGVRVTTASGTRVAFPRDDWDIEQRYDPAPVLITTMTPKDASLGVVVTVRDYVDSAHDAWIRDVSVRADASVVDVQILGYWNLSPTVSRIPQLPLADWVMDAYNDYAALWDSEREAVLHYRPAGRGDMTAITDLVIRPDIDFGPVGAALAEGPITSATATALLASDEAEAPGVWLAVGAREPLVGHQIGFDRTPICDHVATLADNVLTLPTLYPGLVLPLDPSLVDILRCGLTADALATGNGWSELPRSAFDDLQDGALEGSFGAGGQVDEALIATPTRAGDTWSARFVLGAGATAELARASLDAGRAADVTTTTSAFQAELSHARMPRSPTLRAASERALTNLLLAQDKTTGAIVASIARQPSYALDWPRDGAFFDYALDLAGLGERATKHARFTLTTQRTSDVGAEPIINGEPPPDPDDPDKAVFPAGGWEMNSYADGLPGGNIRWEIDNAALAIWTLIEHGERLPEAERPAWRGEIDAVVQRGADLLARWRDAATGLHAPANEDDNTAYTQTLHGAVTTWRALQSAAAHATRVGHADTASRWQARADELRASIDQHLKDPTTGFFNEGLDEAQNPGNAAGGATAWALWPCGLDVPAAPTGESSDQIDQLLDLAAERLDASSPGGAYVTKLLLAAAMRGTKAQRARASGLLEAFVATGAWLGETYVREGAGFEPRVANPHVWAGTLVYLTALALDEDADDDVASEGGGCDAGGASSSLLALVVLLVPLARRRAALVLAGLVVGLGACGDGATDADAADTPDTDASDATETIAEVTSDSDVTDPVTPFTDLAEHTWTWIDVPGTACDDGSPTGIAINRGASDDVLVFFLGGGACWSFETCWLFNTSVHGPFGKPQLTATQAALDNGFAARDRAQNPFADWSYVVVPYCTGDLHGGDRVIDYIAGGITKTTHHVGSRNVQAWLGRLAATFPQPARLVVTGSSAGGFGATLQYDRLRAAFAPTRSWLVDDSGPLLVGDGINDGLRAAWYSSWRLANLTDPVCDDDCQDDLSLMYTRLAARHPDDGIALISSLRDATIAAYLALAPADFEAALRALASDVLAPADARWFFIAGDGHTTLGAPATVTSQGVSLEAWLQAMLDDDASWTSITPP